VRFAGSDRVREQLQRAPEFFMRNRVISRPHGRLCARQHFRHRAAALPDAARFRGLEIRSTFCAKTADGETKPCSDEQTNEKEPV